MMPPMKIKTITDEEILDLILSGRIVVRNSLSRNPLIYQDSKLRVAGLVYGSREGTLPRYRVRIYLPRKKGSRRKKCRERTIVRSKIVWMFKHKKCVPFGHELHHKNEDRLHDASWNIVDWTEEKHRDYHNGEDDVPF